MKWAVTKNNKPVKLQDIPVMTVSEFRDGIIKYCSGGARAVSLFSLPSGKSVKVCAVLAEDEASRLHIASADLAGKNSYESLTNSVPHIHMLERELFEDTGIIPEDHPWLKGVRFGHDRHDKTMTMERFPFFKMDGDEVHEVAVGPIHAGVIESGHFRFMCHGETVYHLEIQLGYQHRGIERLMVENGYRSGMHFAESIAGDTVIGHGTAYAGAIESLAGIEPSKRSQSIRAIALEMERAGIHIGDLATLANDVAYLMGNSVFGATRTIVINSLLLLCGSRLGRGLVRPGGVVFEISPGFTEELKKNLAKVKYDVELMAETMFESASVLSRFDNTGTVDYEAARGMRLVGPAGRASGCSIDVRADHPFGIYRYYPIHKRKMESGDVFARTYMRYIEIKQSIDYIFEQFECLADEGPILTPLKKMQPESLAVSMTEGWRGEIVHNIVTGKRGEIVKYKIKDPSLNNWYGLAYAVRNNGISDFPLCNKSFNLSYCGNDL